MDPERPLAEAFSVRDGRIVYVGERPVAKEIAGSGAREIHYGRGAVLPGLIDSHNHMLWTGIQRAQADISGAKSIEALLASLRRYCCSTSPAMTRRWSLAWAVTRSWVMAP